MLLNSCCQYHDYNYFWTTSCFCCCYRCYYHERIMLCLFAPITGHSSCGAVAWGLWSLWSLGFAIGVRVSLPGGGFFRKSFNLEPCSALVRKACRHCDGSFWCCLGRGVHESFLGAQVAWTHVQRGEMLGSELREFGILTAQFQLDAMQLLRVFQQGARWWRSPSLALDVLAGISWANPHSSRFCARVSEV